MLLDRRSRSPADQEGHPGRAVAECIVNGRRMPDNILKGEYQIARPRAPLRKEQTSDGDGRQPR
jgi:hypothetical protein